MWPVVATHFIKTRLSQHEKRRAHALASQQLITESVWLRRLILAAFNEASDTGPDTEAPLADASQPRHRESRLDVRLRAGDRLLIRERAAARGMPAATYVSFLVRAHLRHLAPLPQLELAALQRSVAELNAIGRNLNQIARALNQRARTAGPDHADLRAILSACHALRDHIKALLNANTQSWETGHAQGPR